MQITALAGGVGGARFLRGLLDHLGPLPHPTTNGATDPDADGPASDGGHEASHDTSPPPRLTVIGNTGDDITLYGLRVCPDLDTVMYTLGGGIHEDQGWGRAGETRRLQDELIAYGAQPQWFTLGDLDLATHVARSQWLGQGLTPSEVTDRLCQRWGLAEQGVRLLPMSDDPIETHVVVDEGQGPLAMHFQEWWVRLRAQVPAQRFVAVGMDRAGPAPGVLEAITDADVVLLPPSNPVVSIGVILGIPGLREALRETKAPVVGVSPVVQGRPVRGHADACLAALELPATASAIAGLYADLLDGWLVAPDDAQAGPWPQGVHVETHPLLMTDRTAAADLAGAALDLALRLKESSALKKSSTLPAEGTPPSAGTSGTT